MSSNTGADALAAHRRSGRWPRLALARCTRVLCGRDPRLHVRVRFCLVAASIHFAWLLIYLGAPRFGFMSPAQAHVMIAVNLIGMFAFYPWVRGGHTARLNDTGLVLPQMVWGSIAVTVAFTMAPALRPALLQVMCLIQVFGFFSLRSLHLAAAGGASVLLLGSLLAFGIAGAIPHFDPQREAYPILASIATLLVLTAITMHQSRRRAALRLQKIELETAVAAVRELVIRDTLTGLFSRGYMLDLLQHEQARSVASGKPFTVALIDLDHFKRINDTHGHGIGDEVLQRFARCATAALRATDSMARWGGEEFLVLMPDTGLGDAPLRPLDQMRRQLREPHAPGAPVLARLGVTFSAGVAVHDLQASIENTVARADRALYAAKQGGRDRCVIDDVLA